ncbi:MAG TPA: hypothetical protein DCE55_16205 [Planctomycetaceae bacterium]|nr:hypothetical protein [Planctomycetaceae bacterium]
MVRVEQGNGGRRPVESLKSMRVEFQHFQSEISDADLRRFGSPHLSRKEAGEELRKRLLRPGVSPVYSTELAFQRSQILCANEVFAESATADPLADLEIWDEWRNQERQFPYPGRYSRLGITEQPGKVSSSTAVGVVGEILTGLFGQSYVAPWVLVRPIRKWPDFIYYTAGGRYAFVESKAFVGDPKTDGQGLARIPRRVLHDCLTDAVQQLNADPFVTVWLGFTEILELSPLHLSVLFLELNAPDERREQVVKRVIPEAIVRGLTERVLSSAIARGDDSLLAGTEGKLSKQQVMGFWDELLGMVDQDIDDVVLNAAPQELVADMKAAIRDRAHEFSDKKRSPVRRERGERLSRAKEQATLGQLGALRQLGEQQLYLVDLTETIRAEFESGWESNWRQANEVWRWVKEIGLWRCSSAAVGLGPLGFEGTSIE